jgi:hypothetical protein
MIETDVVITEGLLMRACALRPHSRTTLFVAWVWIAVAATTLTSAGCGPVHLTQRFEEAPLAKRINASVGMSFPAPVSNYEYKWTFPIQLGSTSVSLFRQVFHSLFEKAQELPNQPHWRENLSGLDGVIELADAKMTMSSEEWKADSPIIGKLKVSFQICLYRDDGALVNCWHPESEKPIRRPGYMGDASRLGEVWAAMNESQLSIVSRTTDAAVREAISRFMIDFERDSTVNAWAAALSGNTRSK